MHAKEGGRRRERDGGNEEEKKLKENRDDISKIAPKRRRKSSTTHKCKMSRREQSLGLESSLSLKFPSKQIQTNKLNFKK